MIYYMGPEQRCDGQRRQGTSPQKKDRTARRNPSPDAGGLFNRGQTMEFKEKNSIKIKQYGNSFIYFLIKDNDVVYVGQTRNGLYRPFSHHDKDFDEVRIIICEESELDEAEDAMIKKYTPKYNRQMNPNINISLKRIRDKIRVRFGPSSYKITELRKTLKKLGIEAKTDIYDGFEYIDRSERDRLYEYMERSAA